MERMILVSLRETQGNSHLPYFQIRGSIIKSGSRQVEREGRQSGGKGEHNESFGR